MAWPSSNTAATTPLTDEVEHLFSASHASSNQPASVTPPPPGPVGFGSSSSPIVPPLNTLDESIWETIKRDLVRIALNLKMVVFPINSRNSQVAALRNFDLWGPVLVFAVVSLGAVVLTLNVVLLGGNIGFFQSMCLLGYCIFPLAIASLVTNFVHNAVARWVVVGVCTAWSSWASVPFVGGSVSEKRRVLAVYPVVLLYISIAWLSLVH